MTDSLVPPTWEPVEAEVAAVMCASDGLDAAYQRVQRVAPLIAARALREAEDDLMLRASSSDWRLIDVGAWLKARAAALEGRAHV